MGETILFAPDESEIQEPNDPVFPIEILDDSAERSRVDSFYKQAAEQQKAAEEEERLRKEEKEREQAEKVLEIAREMEDIPPRDSESIIKDIKERLEGAAEEVSSTSFQAVLKNDGKIVMTNLSSGEVMTVNEDLKDFFINNMLRPMKDGESVINFDAESQTAAATFAISISENEYGEKVLLYESIMYSGVEGVTAVQPKEDYDGLPDDIDTHDEVEAQNEPNGTIHVIKDTVLHSSFLELLGLNEKPIRETLQAHAGDTLPTQKMASSSSESVFGATQSVEAMQGDAVENEGEAQDSYAVWQTDSLQQAGATSPDVRLQHQDPLPTNSPAVEMPMSNDVFALHAPLRDTGKSIEHQSSKHVSEPVLFTATSVQTPAKIKNVEAVSDVDQTREHVSVMVVQAPVDTPQRAVVKSDIFTPSHESITHSQDVAGTELSSPGVDSQPTETPVQTIDEASILQKIPAAPSASEHSFRAAVEVSPVHTSAENKNKEAVPAVAQTREHVTATVVQPPVDAPQRAVVKPDIFTPSHESITHSQDIVGAELSSPGEDSQPTETPVQTIEQASVSQETQNVRTAPEQSAYTAIEKSAPVSRTIVEYYSTSMAEVGPEQYDAHALAHESITQAGLESTVAPLQTVEQTSTFQETPAAPASSKDSFHATVEQSALANPVFVEHRLSPIERVKPEHIVVQDVAEKKKSARLVEHIQQTMELVAAESRVVVERHETRVDVMWGEQNVMDLLPQEHVVNIQEAFTDNSSTQEKTIVFTDPVTVREPGVVIMQTDGEKTSLTYYERPPSQRGERIQENVLNKPGLVVEQNKAQLQKDGIPVMRREEIFSPPAPHAASRKEVSSQPLVREPVMFIKEDLDTRIEAAQNTVVESVRTLDINNDSTERTMQAPLDEPTIAITSLRTAEASFETSVVQQYVAPRERKLNSEVQNTVEEHRAITESSQDNGSREKYVREKASVAVERREVATAPFSDKEVSKSVLEVPVKSVEDTAPLTQGEEKKPSIAITTLGGTISFPSAPRREDLDSSRQRNEEAPLVNEAFEEDADTIAIHRQEIEVFKSFHGRSQTANSVQDEDDVPSVVRVRDNQRASV